MGGWWETRSVLRFGVQALPYRRGEGFVPIVAGDRRRLAANSSGFLYLCSLVRVVLKISFVFVVWGGGKG